MAILEVLGTLAPYVSALAGVGTALINKSTNTSAAKSQQYQNSTVSNASQSGNSQTDSTSQTAGSMSQTSSTTGSTEQTGNTAGVANALGTAMSTPTGNNANQAAAWNAGQATTANNLQGSMWSLANLINVGSQAASAMLTAKSQTSAQRYNTDEGKANRDWQQMMSNTAYQRQVQDLKAAGLNPILAAFNGGASTPSGGYGSISGQTYSHTSAASIPAAHTATMQSMFDYGNNTSQFLQNALSAINSAKQTGNYTEAKKLEQMTESIVSSSAKTVESMSSSTSGSESGSSGESSTERQQVNALPKKQKNESFKEGGGHFTGGGGGRGR